MAFHSMLGNINIIGEHIDANFSANVLLVPYWTYPSNYPQDPADQPAWVKSNCTQTTYSIGSSNVVVPLKKYNPLMPATETSLVMGGIDAYGEDGVNAAWKANLALSLAQTTFARFVKDYPNYYLGWVEIKKAIGGDPVAYCLMSWIAEGEGITPVPAAATTSTLVLSYLRDNFNLTVTTVNYDPDYGEPSEPDGYGQSSTAPAFDHSSDVITIPDAPTVSTSAVGFMNVHVVSAGALATLGQYLFPTLTSITDIESALRNMVGLFYGRDSIQYIVDLHAIPVTPATVGSKYIKLGSIETDISQPYTTTDYVDYDCGSVSIPENFCNFVDYIGTTCKLFLPFVGFVTISPEYWNGGTLSVKYRFNVIDGSFMAYVRSTSSKSQLANSLIGQYGGCACLHLPVVARSYGSLVSGIVSGSMSTTPNKSGYNVGTDAGALSAYNFQGDMQQSNNYNCSTAFLGGRTPYLIIEREVPSFSTLYNKDKGLPLNVALPLSGVHGFTVIEDIDLSGITGATDNELDELRRLLSEGVYF